MRTTHFYRGVHTYFKPSRQVELVYQTLRAARPTAVDPVNAMHAVRDAMRSGTSVAERQAYIGRVRDLAKAACAEWLDVKGYAA